MNEVTLIGRVVRPPVYHCTAGEARDLVRIELETRGRDQDTQCHHCQAWGPAALNLHRFLRVGNQLMIRGELRYRSPGRAGGGGHERPVIEVKAFSFLDGRAVAAATARPSPLRPSVPGFA